MFISSPQLIFQCVIYTAMLWY